MVTVRDGRWEKRNLLAAALFTRICMSGYHSSRRIETMSRAEKCRNANLQRNLKESSGLFEFQRLPRFLRYCYGTDGRRDKHGNLKMRKRNGGTLEAVAGERKGMNFSC